MKKIIGSFLLICIFLFGFISCFSNDDYDKTDKIRIANVTISADTTSIRAPLTDHRIVGILVKEGNDERFLPLDWIKDFEYELGFEYELKVKIVTPADPIQDAFDSFYYLLEILSKKKKRDNFLF